MIKIELSISLYVKLVNFSQLMYGTNFFKHFMIRFEVNRMVECKCSRFVLKLE